MESVAIGPTTARGAANVVVVEVAVEAASVMTVVGEATPATVEADPHLATGRTDAEVGAGQVRDALLSSVKDVASFATKKVTSSVTVLRTVVAPCTVEDALMIVAVVAVMVAVMVAEMVTVMVIVVGTRDTDAPLLTLEAAAPPHADTTTTVEVDTKVDNASRWDHLPVDNSTLGHHLPRRTGPVATVENE